MAFAVQLVALDDRSRFTVPTLHVRPLPRYQVVAARTGSLGPRLFNGHLPRHLFFFTSTLFWALRDIPSIAHVAALLSLIWLVLQLVCPPNNIRPRGGGETRYGLHKRMRRHQQLIAPRLSTVSG